MIVFLNKCFSPKASYGYGGKFGVQKDRMDQSVVGWDYEGKVDKHASQKGWSLLNCSLCNNLRTVFVKILPVTCISSTLLT